MRAAILEKIGAPLTVADVKLPEKLERGQVLVQVLCTGICGSQLQEIDGIKGNPEHLPHLLGHEGCGIVEKTGEGVEGVMVGDKVVMHWRKGWGIEAKLAVYGSIKSGPITTFSEFAIVSENRVTKVPDDIPNDFAALLGCALSTGLAIIEKEAKLKSGESLMVVGCGGVGLSVIFAARKLSFCTVYGLDVSPFKSKLAAQFGAIGMTRDWSILAFPICDVTIDTIFSPRTVVGKRYISLQANGTSAGGFDPTFDIPRYVEMWRQGMLDGYEKLITHRLKLDQINHGIQLMRDGKAGRVMIEMP